MMFAAVIALPLTFAGILKPDATGDQHMEQWDPVSRRMALYQKVTRALTEKESKHGEPCEAIDWALAHFIDGYLGDAEAHAPSAIPDTWIIDDHTEHYDLTEDFSKLKTTAKNSKMFEDFMFKDFIKKYEPAVVWEQKEKALGRNYTNHVQSFKGWDSTDELLDLNTSISGRRFWKSQWQIPQLPNDKSLKRGDLQTVLYFMKQAIYHARNRMTVMQQLRELHRATALYKMGYLFAKTDYACKIFSSLAFKAFRDCSMTRQEILAYNRVYKTYMDVAYNIERLITRWFDIDLLKDLLISNDMIARGVLLRDENLTTPEMVVEAFNEMFID